MSRDIPYEEDLICDLCGAKGGYDFMEDVLCPKCAEKNINKGEGCKMEGVTDIYKKIWITADELVGKDKEFHPRRVIDNGGVYKVRKKYIDQMVQLYEYQMILSIESDSVGG